MIWYQPETGRFVGIDPDPGQMNEPNTFNSKYIYSLNNPANRLDPMGTSSFFSKIGTLFGSQLIGGAFGQWAAVNFSGKFSASEISLLNNTLIGIASAMTGGAAAFEVGLVAGGGAAGAIGGTVVGGVVGAVTGGTLGGAIALARGESFIDGFMSGVKVGAVAGAAAGFSVGYNPYKYLAKSSVGFNASCLVGFAGFALGGAALVAAAPFTAGFSLSGFTFYAGAVGTGSLIGAGSIGVSECKMSLGNIF